MFDSPVEFATLVCMCLTLGMSWVVNELRAMTAELPALRVPARSVSGAKLVSTCAQDLRVFGFRTWDRVATTLGPGTVVGAADGHLWLWLDRDGGVSHWADIHSFADVRTRRRWVRSWDMDVPFDVICRIAAALPPERVHCARLAVERAALDQGR